MSKIPVRAPAVGRMPSNLRTWPFSAKIPKNWLWGAVDAVSAKFSGDLKVAHGDSATDEPKKFRFWIDGPEIWPG